MADDGLITLPSAHPVAATIDRLTRLVEARGLHVFARIDHADGAANAGMSLRPTQLIIFGNPEGGTPLMLDRQTTGIDLPIKALAWEDAEGHVWLSYNDPAWIAQRHGLGEASRSAVDAMKSALAVLLTSAAAG